jgi:hypothetical protein
MDRSRHPGSRIPCDGQDRLGSIWRLPATAELAAQAADIDRPHPNPTLVQVGTTTDDAELFIDLENIGLLAIDDTSAGGAQGMRAIARAFTATLTTSPLADIPRIRTTGFDPYGLGFQPPASRAHAWVCRPRPPCANSLTETTRAWSSSTACTCTSTMTREGTTPREARKLLIAS